MKIVFSMDGIKNMGQLYTWTTKSSEIFGCEGKAEHYHGVEYCTAVIAQLTGWKEKKYTGMRDRIANETFILVSPDEAEYTVAFEIDTYNEKVARLEVRVSAPETESYDQRLEGLKVALKIILIPDWRICTWLVDEQAAKLCKEAYEKAFIIENNLRAFASKVLIHFLGDGWLRRAGLEKQAEFVKELAKKFTQRVRDFDDINTDFLSMTLETLVSIIFEGVVYKDVVVLSRQEYDQVIRLCDNAKSPCNIADFLKKRRPVEKKIWNDIFVPFISDTDAFKVNVHAFIEDRNHVAHSKVLSWNAYQVMLKDFQNMVLVLLQANTKFEREETSEELLHTWDAMEQEELEPEYEKEYYRERLDRETGMEILDEDEIEDWFEEVMHNLYSDVYQRYHLDAGFEVSDFDCASYGEESFTVSCPVDEKLVISISAEYSIDDDLGGDGTCYIVAIGPEKQVICKAEARFHNGHGSEGEDEFMEADENTEYDAPELAEFTEDLIAAIDELNPYPTKLDDLAYEYKGSEQFVADFPCEQCGKFMVSVNEEFLPVGRCGYCGYEHELDTCIRCGAVTSILEHGLCTNHAAFVDKK